MIILYLYCLSFASETDEKKLEEEYKLQHYKDIKKQQQKEYKKGIYNDDTKKDYVNDWIGKDISYQKKVIKLKKDYREWATDKISKKQKVRFKDYEPLKKLPRVERQILYDYHNMLFKEDKKQKSSVRRKPRKRKKTPMKKPVSTNIIVRDEIIPVPENLKDISITEDTESKIPVHYILLTVAGLFFIAASTILILKKYYYKKKV